MRSAAWYTLLGCCLSASLVSASNPVATAAAAPPPASTAAIVPMNSPSSAPSGTCASIRTRYECRELSTTQQQALFSAFKTLMGNGGYTKYVDWHVSVTNTAHGVPAFFPWHREYLRRLETDLGVDLCYWDWSSDAQVPEASPFLMPGWCGTNGQSNAGGCITDAFWSGFTYQGQCPSSQWDGTSGGIGAFYAIEFVSSLITANSAYEGFHVAYEGTAHARIHNGIGGQFSQMTSPSNPIFFFHHANVDRHWAIWQWANPNTATSYPQPLTTQLPVFNIPVSQVMSTQAAGYCYTYSNMDIIHTGQSTLGLLHRRALSVDAPNALDSAHLVTLNRRGQCDNSNSAYTSPADDDRSNLIDLRQVKNTPDWWLEMEHLNKTVIREVEAGHLCLINTLNQLPGYISPMALYNRPKLLAHVIRNAPSGTKFHLYKPGQSERTEFDLCDEDRANPEGAVHNFRRKVEKEYPVQDYEALRPHLENVVGVKAAHALITSGKKHANRPYGTLPENQERGGEQCVADYGDEDEGNGHHKRHHHHRRTIYRRSVTHYIQH